MLHKETYLKNKQICIRMARDYAVNGIDFTRRIRPKTLTLVFLLMMCLQPLAEPAGEDVAQLMSIGDTAFAHRAEGRQRLQASPAGIHQAVEAYRQVLVQDPKNVEAYWKLLRSLIFEGHYATTDRKRKQALFAEGKKVAENALRVLDEDIQKQLAQPAEKLSFEQKAQVLKGIRGAPETYYYTGTMWAEWSRAYGVIAAIRQGAAAKIRDFETLSSLIDEKVRYGGGYRALGRLHHKCPRIPLVTGWVWMLEQVIADPPDEDLLIEDLNLQAQAAQDLKGWAKK